MIPLPIPLSTIQAYGGTPVKIDPPQNFELTNGEKIPSIPGMKVGDVTYILMGVEEIEREALSRTHAFYLGFLSGFIPVFTLRVADIIHGQTDDPFDPLPILFANFEMVQEAHDEWERLTEYVACKQIHVKTELRWEDGEVGNQIIEENNYLVHDFRTGQVLIVSSILIDMLRIIPEIPETKEIGIEEVEDEEGDNSQLQQPDGNGEHPKAVVPEL